MPTLRTAEIDQAKNNEALGINLDLIEERREQEQIQKLKSKKKMEKYITTQESRVKVSSRGDMVLPPAAMKNGRISMRNMVLQEITLLSRRETSAGGHQSLSGSKDHSMDANINLFKIGETFQYDFFYFLHSPSAYIQSNGKGWLPIMTFFMLMMDGEPLADLHRS
ncbi:hypothetical protein Tco_0110815 [Tanacetum coccineum]